jgi:hypothetical protein
MLSAFLGKNPDSANREPEKFSIQAMVGPKEIL